MIKKIKMLVGSLLILSLFPFFAFGKGNVVSAASLSTTDQFANELKYIFSELYTKDVNGKYVVNEKELLETPYSEKELREIQMFVSTLNDDPIIIPRSRSWNNTIKRCIADGKNIGNDVLNEIGKQLNEHNWIAAAGILAGAIGASVPGMLLFIAFCGATPVY